MRLSSSLLCVLCLISGVAISHAQSARHLWIGAGVSYRSLAIGAERTNNAELRIDSPPPDIFLHPFVVAGVQFDLRSELQFKPSVRLWYAPISGSGSRPVILAVDGVAVDATLQTSYTTQVVGAGIDLGFRWQVADNAGVSAIPGVLLAAPISISMQDRIVTGTDVVFASSSGVTQTVPSARVPSSVEIIGVLGIELDVEFMRLATSSLSAVLSSRVSTNDIASMTSHIPWEVGFGLQLSFNGDRQAPDLPSSANPALPLARRMRTLFDTVNVVDTWSKERTGTLYVAKDRVIIDTLYSSRRDTLTIRDKQTIERHLPGPPPYLLSLLELDVKGLPFDSLITLEIRGTVIGDGNVTTITRVYIDGTMVDSSTYVGEHFTQRIRMHQILQSRTVVTSARISITAETTDVHGQVVQATPVHVFVRRSASHKVDIDIP